MVNFYLFINVNKIWCYFSLSLSLSLSLSHIINENSTIRFIESYIELMKMKPPDFWEVRMFTMVHFSLGSGGQQ